MKVYEMEMEFEVVVGLNDLNDFMSHMGFDEKTGVKGCILTIKQTIPFIPDENYLEKISNVIVENYKTDKIEILECKFKGYKKFLERDVEIPEKK